MNHKIRDIIFNWELHFVYFSLSDLILHTNKPKMMQNSSCM